MTWEAPEDPSPLLESYSSPRSGLRRFEAPGMGTLNALLLPAEGHSDSEIAETAHEAFSRLEAIEERLSKFRPHSDVSLLNSLGAQRDVTIGSELLELLVVARRAWELSDGAFDVTIGGLLRAWGLVDLRGRVPESHEIDELLERRGMNLLELDEERSTARFRRPGVSVDLGALGKGYAADRIADDLKTSFECGAVLMGSSTIVAWGRPPGESAWRVDLVHPENREESLAEADIEPGALSSSGTAERAILVDGRKIGHILDPRSGRPIDHERTVASVTVWTPTALVGDILSTTLFVLATEALEAGGAAERIVAELPGDATAARATMLLVEPSSSAWGGLSKRFHALGEPGFRLGS